MLSFLRKIILLLSFFFKLKILRKNNYDIVIFDIESKFDLDYLLKEKKKIFYLADRNEHFNKIFLSNRIFKNFFKFFDGNLKRSYQAALIETMCPKIVLTFIDTNWRFGELAKIFSKSQIKFIAIQNGAKFTFQEYKELFEKGIIKENVNQKLFIPNILTLSEYEQELSKIYKIKINNFQNVGSLRLYNFYHYKKFIKKQKIEFSKLPTYDLAILSDYNGWDQRLGIDYTKKILETLNTIIEIVIRNKLNCVFLYKATKKNLIKREKEHSLYKNGLYKNNFDFISNKIIERNSRFGTYEILLKTNLLIGTISTLLRENIALGGKSLACNQTPKNIYDFPINGICNIKNFNPEELEQRILYLLQISRKNYSKTLGSNKDYVCNTNYKKTKKLILQNLNI
tara:strand:- start:636 stop:1829 length:1194 start_codon:yes stop_codon:yes gene_type:complete